MRILVQFTAILAGLLALSATMVPSALAQERDDEADHQALREFKTLFEKAASENNLELMKPHLHQPFSVVTYTDREFSDFEAFKARWQKTRDEIVGSGSYKVTLLPERSEIYGDIAIAHGDSENVLITGAGKEYHFTSHWTAVFRKVDGQWKIVRVHSSLDPFGNPMVVGEVWRKVTQVGVGAGVGGLILGGLFAFMVLRRRARAVPAARTPGNS
ncbi:MAG: nuclear transport factor 2 family protein [Pirellulaceae bacterium]|nr:nuclear transport factor 2 family protein [Pirellulaceae bacterium]